MSRCSVTVRATSLGVTSVVKTLKQVSVYCRPAQRGGWRGMSQTNLRGGPLTDEQPSGPRACGASSPEQQRQRKIAAREREASSQEGVPAAQGNGESSRGRRSRTCLRLDRKSVV